MDVDEEIMDYLRKIEQYPIDYGSAAESAQVAKGRTTKVLDGFRELPFVSTMVLVAVMIIAMVVK